MLLFYSPFPSCVGFESLEDASKLFDQMPLTNTVSFVTLAQGFSRSHQFHRALHLLLKEGYEVNQFVFTTLLKLLGMVSWTGMMACYAENYCHEDSLLLFCQMRVMGFRPNNFEVGKSVHGCALKACYDRDLYVGTVLLELLTKSGEIAETQQFFEEMPKDDLIPWSLMIARYAQSDKSREALELFCRMRQSSVVPNNSTFASVLQACASSVSLNLGKQIHSNVLKVGLDSNVFVSNALMDKNEVTWNTIIVGYVQLGDGEKALNLFSNMLGYDIHPTEVTYSSVLRASASLVALEPGRQIHSLTIKTMYNKDSVVANSLIDMYAKCGRIDDSRLAFDKMDKRDEVSWNAIICGGSKFI
uniref:Pentacotripeptide-repeat region of PRORP domain-containing protein n=1 Tax=Glycine max TaxID=3847 RepID=A0A0R0E5L7_SOYBN